MVIDIIMQEYFKVREEAVEAKKLIFNFSGISCGLNQCSVVQCGVVQCSVVQCTGNGSQLARF